MTAMGRLRAGSNVKGWLFTIMRSTWLNRVRHRHIEREADAVDLDQTCADKVSEYPHEQLTGKVDRARVRTAIQRLPAEYREFCFVNMRNCRIRRSLRL
jgi:DNA-directed RNA polymerase specialized sigma24 family protein